MAFSRTLHRGQGDEKEGREKKTNLYNTLRNAAICAKIIIKIGAHWHTESYTEDEAFSQCAAENEEHFCRQFIFGRRSFIPITFRIRHTLALSIFGVAFFVGIWLLPLCVLLGFFHSLVFFFIDCCPIHASTPSSFSCEKHRVFNIRSRVRHIQSYTHREFLLLFSSFLFESQQLYGNSSIQFLLFGVG